MKSENLAQKAKKQILKGFFYWLVKYIMTFVTNALVVILIEFVITTPIIIIFGAYEYLISGLLGGFMGCLTVLTIHNIPKYQNYWLHMKLNITRLRCINATERLVIGNKCYNIVTKGYIETQLNDIMEDFRA